MIQNLLGLYNIRKVEISKKPYRFFLDLIEIMKNIPIVNDKAIAKINDKITKLQKIL